LCGYMYGSFVDIYRGLLRVYRARLPRIKTWPLPHNIHE